VAGPLVANGVGGQWEEFEPQSRKSRNGSQRRGFHGIGKMVNGGLFAEVGLWIDSLDGYRSGSTSASA
jgi:hypothetical protein